MITNKTCITQLALTKDGSAINIILTSEGSTIKGISSYGNEVNKVSIVDTNNIKVFKLVMSKDLV